MAIPTNFVWFHTTATRTGVTAGREKPSSGGTVCQLDQPQRIPLHRLIRPHYVPKILVEPFTKSPILSLPASCSDCFTSRFFTNDFAWIRSLGTLRHVGSRCCEFRPGITSVHSSYLERQTKSFSCQSKECDLSLHGGWAEPGRHI